MASNRQDTPSSTDAVRGWILLGSPLLAGAFVIGVMFLAIVGAMMALGRGPGLEYVQHSLRGLASNYYGEMGVTIFAYLALFLSILLFLPKSGPASLRSYFRPVSPATIAWALTSGVLFAVIVGIALTLLARSGAVTFHETSAERALLPRERGQLTIAFAAIALVGPFVEEIYFRGLLLRWLRTKMPLALAALPNAALFAATHFRFATHVGAEGLVLTSGLFLFGLFAVAWASATRSLWPSFLAHGMYNATIIAAPLLANSSS